MKRLDMDIISDWASNLSWTRFSGLLCSASLFLWEKKKKGRRSSQRFSLIWGGKNAFCWTVHPWIKGKVYAQKFFCYSIVHFSLWMTANQYTNDVIGAIYKNTSNFTGDWSVKCPSYKSNRILMFYIKPKLSSIHKLFPESLTNGQRKLTLWLGWKWHPNRG